MTTQLNSRRVTHLQRGLETRDGDGVRLTRIIGTSMLPDLDPFLMLDEFGSDQPHDYRGGFPEHPHRGFETVTYMLAGRMRHGDNHGHSGVLGPGSVQWMSAGRGIVHSEMPEQEEGLMRGFQLWVNLPARLKMAPAKYQEFPPAEIPTVTAGEGVEVKVIAGELQGVTGPVAGVATRPIYWDVTLAPGARFTAPVPATHQGFLYAFEGSLVAGPADATKPVNRRWLAVLGAGDAVELAAGDQGARLILVAGVPLQEPVARYGPFVMNTQEEIQQAFADYRDGRF